MLHTFQMILKRKGRRTEAAQGRKASLALFLVLLLILSSCNHHDSGHRKYYSAYDNVIDVKQDIREVPIEDVDISAWGKPYLLNDYLLLSDVMSYDKLIHIFDKNTFKYLTSVGNKGQGPGEIANLVNIIPDEKANTFYAIDYGNLGLLSFPMDSILTNPDYVPTKKAGIEQTEFPIQLQYVSDTVSYGMFWHILNARDYVPLIAKWNMKTGERTFMKYTGHPDVERKRVKFAASPEHGLYVELYQHHDLISFCTLAGELKCNAYGKQWNDLTSNADQYFDEAVFCGDKVVASYLGRAQFYEQDGQTRVYRPDKLLVFDLEGNHLSTLDIGYAILSFCYDAENKRLLFTFDDEIQFGYLDLGNIL